MHIKHWDHRTSYCCLLVLVVLIKFRSSCIVCVILIRFSNHKEIFTCIHNTIDQSISILHYQYLVAKDNFRRTSFSFVVT